MPDRTSPWPPQRLREEGMFTITVEIPSDIMSTAPLRRTSELRSVESCFDAVIWGFSGPERRVTPGSYLNSSSDERYDLF